MAMKNVIAALASVSKSKECPLTKLEKEPIRHDRPKIAPPVRLEMAHLPLLGASTTVARDIGSAVTDIAVGCVRRQCNLCDRASQLHPWDLPVHTGRSSKYL